MISNRVIVARIGAAHGIRGEVRLHSFTEDPLAIADFDALEDEQGRRFKVMGLKRAGKHLVARFKGVDSREQAEALNGVELSVDRGMLDDASLEEDEFFQEDLVGLKVHDEKGGFRGSVIAVHNFGAGDILELKPASGRSVMIPFTETAVLEIDFDEERIMVDPIAAGLVDLDDDVEESGQ